MRAKINNVQALRAYAALSVVIYHTGYVFPGMLQMGKFGVDIFFVLSGYIMARICETDTRFFLRRRMVRIVPPYWILTILLFCFAQIFPALLLATHPSLVDLVRSLLFIPTYRQDLIRPVLFVGWTLNYEIFFYLLVTLGIFLFPKRPLVAATTLLVVIHLVSKQFAGLGAIPMCYSNSIVYEFALGVLAYEAARRVREAAAVRLRPLSLVGLLSGLAGIIWLQGVAHQPFRAEWAAMQVCATLVVLSASLLSQGGWDVKAAWIVLVGDSSYVLYLTHAYVLNVVDRVIGKRLPWIQITHASGAAAALVLCTLLAVLLHLKLEVPALVYLNQRFGGRRRTAEFSPLHASPGQVAP